MTKAKLMTEAEVDRLQEAGEDVAYLASQGYHPTDAVAKVASAAKLTRDQTNLLIHAYSAGVAAEKRASAGGPFARLAEYDLPDPNKVMEIVFGRKPSSVRKEAAMTHCPAFDPNGQTKTASTPPVFDLRFVDKDLSGMSEEDVHELFYPGTKVAAASPESLLENLRKPGSGVSMTVTTISVGKPGAKKEECDDCEEDDDGFVHCLPQTAEECLKAGLKMMSPELSDKVDSVLRDMIKKSAIEKTEAYAEASMEYAQIGGMVMQFGNRLQRQFEDPSYKAAGLASVNAYYPEVAKLVQPFLDEVLVYKLKTAQYGVLALSKQHEFVAAAKEIQEQVEKAAELTIKANEIKEYHDDLVDLFKTRPRGRRGDWAKIALLPVTGVEKIDKGLGYMAGGVYGGGKRLFNTGKERWGATQKVWESPAVRGEDANPSVGCYGTAGKSF